MIRKYGKSICGLKQNTEIVGGPIAAEISCSFDDVHISEDSLKCYALHNLKRLVLSKQRVADVNVVGGVVVDY